MTSPASGEQRNTGTDLLLLTLLIGGAYLVSLGHWPLEVPSEARYAEIPREMVTSGDWLTPRINGVKFFDKPPLVYWLQAIATELFGRSEFAARFWTVAFGVGNCLVVYVAGARLWSRRAGLLAAVMLATAAVYFALSRKILLDMPMAFFLTVTFTAFLLGMQAPSESRTRARAMYVMYAAAAAATLTKGLIAIVLPGITVFAWLLITGRWHELRHARLVSGTLLFLVIAVPWHVAVGLKNPEFFWFYFVHEHYLRFVTSEHGRDQPAWFFAAVLLVGWLPWSVFLPSALVDAARAWWRERRRHDAALFVLLWFALPFVFFSISHSKLIPYSLMFFPPLALLLGRYVDRKLELGQASAFAILAAAPCVLAVVFGVLAFAPALVIGARYLPDVAAIAGLPWMTGGFVVAALVVTWAALRNAAGIAIAVAVAVGAAAGWTGEAIWAQVQPSPSVKPLAGALRQRLRPDDEVASLYLYYQDLPYYLGRIVSVAAAQPAELVFGRSVEDTSGWMIDETEFWRRWNRPERTMYAVMPASRFAMLAAGPSKHLHALARTRTDVLVINRPPG